MKNRRGEIATLLTLGLVLVGGLVTLATSFIINRQNNLASNPRAGLNCPTGSYCRTNTSSCSSIGQINVGAECIVGTKEGICCKPSSTSITPTKTPTPAQKGYGSGGKYGPADGDGFDLKVCSNELLPFACCVQDKFLCGGDDRFRWYGCTGQPCGNTKINQSNGPGNLVPCKYGVGPSKVESCAVATPTSSPNTCETRNSQYQYRDYEYDCRSSCTGGFSSFPSLSCGSSAQKCCRKPRANSTPVPTLAGIGGENESNTSGEESNSSNQQNENEITNTPTPTLIASNLCKAVECVDPSEGIFYSYKCATVPQTINGKTECPVYNFYGGKECKGSVQIQNSEDIMNETYCQATYTSSEAKRKVKITYTVNQAVSLQVDPNDPVTSLHIYVGGSGWRPEINKIVNITIGVDRFPVTGEFEAETGANVIEWTYSYVPVGKYRRSGWTTLSSGEERIVNNEATIEFTIE